MTKLLILSDSHGSAEAVQRILTAESDADAVIYLGDGLHDLERALIVSPKLRVYSVAGNCDYGALEPLDGLAAFDSVVVFYTHGHMYGVKYYLDTLARPQPPAGRKWPCSGIPTSPWPSSTAPSCCSTPVPAGGVMWGRTPTAS